MKDSFRRILDLVRKTGDTMIVTDPNTEDIFVVMDVDRYEMLMDIGFDEENTDDLEELEDNQNQREKDIWQTMKSASDDTDTWDMEQMNKQELEELEDQYRQFTNKNVQAAIDENTEKKPKNEPKTQSDEGFNEEQFYLEPVE